MIEIVHDVDETLLEAINRLLPQLSSSTPPLSLAQLEAVVASPLTTFFVARIDGEVVGTLTLVQFPILTGMRAWIEDVIVDDAVRGRGVGAALVVAANEHAKAGGARTVDLTSRPAREAANALYRKVGFVQRETNVYRFDLD
jgi:ribosomal protein S18 acetylase RimI-like enzyme